MSRGKGRKKFKKGVFILPSIFTSLNLFARFTQSPLLCRDTFFRPHGQSL